MRKIILGLAVSLDGFIEGPNGEYDWCMTDQDYGMNEFFGRIDAVFIGRKSYEAAQGMEGSMDFMPKMTEYVFSNTLENVKEGSILVKGNIEEEVNRIKNSEGKDIWLFGGAKLTTTMINLKLLDELWLSVHPILLGEGKPLFNNIKGRIKLNLLETKQYDTGLVSLKYEVKK